MQITMQRARPAWPVKAKLRMTEDCSRIAKEFAMMSGIFCRGQEVDIAFFLQKTRIRKIWKIFQENWSIIVRNRVIQSNEPWNTETNKLDENAPITSKHVFPKRSAKIIKVFFFTPRKASLYFLLLERIALLSILLKDGG